MSATFVGNLPPGYIDFFKNLENWQNQESARIRKFFPKEKLEFGKLLARFNHALLEIKHPDIRVEDFKHTFSNLLVFLITARPEISESPETIIKLATQLNYQEILSSCLHGGYGYINELEQTAGFPGDVFLFTTDHALRPYLRIWAAPYQEDLYQGNIPWPFLNTCPLCGSKSHFSRLRNPDGIRFMFCERCFSEWPTPYPVCVYCQNQALQDLQTLLMENQTHYMVYVCEKCKGYIKTYDERLSGQTTDLYIANMETIYLDLLAHSWGYTTHS